MRNPDPIRSTWKPAQVVVPMTEVTGSRTPTVPTGGSGGDFEPEPVADVGGGGETQVGLGGC
jgi:hypothetical protein